MVNRTNERLEAVTATTVIVGIDVAKEIHWARITNYRGVDLCKPVKINNNIKGFESLVEKLKKIEIKNKSDKIMIGMEPSGHYWRALGWYLKLHESQPILVGVNPYHTKQAKELDDNSQTKSDKKDALIIAHLVRDGRYFDTYLPENEYAEMRVLNSERQRIMKQISRANNVIVAVMDEYFPELSIIWEKITCPTSREIIKEVTFPTDILEIEKEELVRIIRKASNGKEGHLLADELYEKASRSVGVLEGKKSVKAKLLRLIEELEFYEKRKDEVESELEEMMTSLEFGEILQSMKGIGPIISAAFVGEVGDLTRFNNWKQERKLAGLNLVEQSSGKHVGKSKVSKRGRPYLRHMLFIAGEACCKHNGEMRQLYHYFMKRRENPLTGYQAFVAVGLKIMRIMFYMVKNKKKYDPKKALGTVREAQILSLS